MGINQIRRQITLHPFESNFYVGYSDFEIWCVNFTNKIVF